MTRRLVLAFDPGITTGVALIGHSGSFRDVETYVLQEARSWPQISAALTMGLELHYAGRAMDIVVEKQPHNPTRPDTLELQGSILAELQERKLNYWLYAPGEWKPVMKLLRQRPQLKTRSSHELDAWQMGVYHIRKLGAKNG